MKVFREFLIRDHAWYSYDIQKVLKYRRHYLDVCNYMDMVEDYFDLDKLL